MPHTGHNPYENVISSSNVSALTLDWTYATNAYNCPPLSSPAVANGGVYTGEAYDKLYALDAVTGTRKWSYTTGSCVTSSPAVANGIVYVISGGTLYTFHLPGMSS